VSFFQSLEIYNDTAPRSAAVNMAIDELLWQSATIPRLRFYEWDHPALSFGYFGRFTDVANFKSERELVRRCTGGGVVFHGNDLTYALVIPANEEHQERSTLKIYRCVHQAMQAALRDVGIEATLVERGDRSSFAARNATATDACFANPVAFDVMINDKKIAGAAQRRSRRGLLQQGSIQNVELSPKFQKAFIARLCERRIQRVIDSPLLARAQQLADVKYNADEWLRRL
jgi:lipoate-protein ligase A